MESVPDAIRYGMAAMGKPAPIAWSFIKGAKLTINGATFEIHSVKKNRLILKLVKS